jgi:hypothetical protein
MAPVNTTACSGGDDALLLGAVMHLGWIETCVATHRLDGRGPIAGACGRGLEVGGFSRIGWYTDPGFDVALP